MRFQFDRDPRSYSIGEEHAEAITARLFWHITGRGPTGSATAAERRFDSPPLRGHLTWHLCLPDNPWSFVGKFTTLHCAVELATHPGKQLAQAELTIAPGGREIRLDSILSQASP
jgi:hypothetical protein